MHIQRIRYERTGGFAGMRFHADFEPGDLPEDQSRRLLDLLDEMDFEELPNDLTRGASHPDQFTYTITVQTDKGEHTVVVGDSSAPEEMQEFLRMLDRIARKKH